MTTSAGSPVIDMNIIAVFMVIGIMSSAFPKKKGNTLKVPLPKLVSVGKVLQKRGETIEAHTTYMPPKSIADGLRSSMHEEQTAADWYRKRAQDAVKKGDTDTAYLYEHIAGEEDGHYTEYSNRLGEITKGKG